MNRHSIENNIQYHYLLKVNREQCLEPAAHEWRGFHLPLIQGIFAHKRRGFKPYFGASFSPVARSLLPACVHIVNSALESKGSSDSANNRTTIVTVMIRCCQPDDSWCNSDIVREWVLV